MNYNVTAVRSHFPALAEGAAHFDGPGGSQSPTQVARAVADVLTSAVANKGTVTTAERRATEIVDAARAAGADLLGADPHGIVFGRSMTQLTYDFARTLAKSWSPGDEVVVTRLDHDANVRPWVQAAAAAGATVRFATFDPVSGVLTPDDVARVLSPRTRLVAVTAASNLLGSRPDLPTIAATAHEAGALVYVDGVHYTPHAFVDIDALAVAIRTGAGLVLHTGDFKMDQLPLDGRITDLRAFARLGEEGVDLFMVDSTNAEVPGFTTSERDISPVLERVFHDSRQRIIVACFASHVHRVQQVLDAAVEHGRKVAYVGRSMVRNMAIARDLGFLQLPPGVLVDAKELAELPPERQVLISTGSQGEPLSALSRIAQRNHNFVHIEAGDTVVLASSLIPGNENAVYRVINGLARWGANVVHKGNALVHVSGHASAGELLYAYNIVKPRNVLPVHGEIRHMLANGALAASTGVMPENVVIAEDGVVVDLVDGRARIAGKVECGYVFVDGSSVGDITESDLKDRRILGEEGFISVIVVVDSVTGKVSGGPEIHARGFAEDDSTFDEIKQPIIDALDRAIAEGVDDNYQLQQAVRRVVGRWVSNTHRRRPMIIPVVLEA